MTVSKKTIAHALVTGVHACPSPLTDAQISMLIRWLSNKPPLPLDCAEAFRSALIELQHHRAPGAVA